MLGPVFWWEVTSTSRRLRYFLARALYGTLFLALFWLCHHFTYGSQTQWTLAQSALFNFGFFSGFSLIQLFCAVLVTYAVSAGTVAEERERRTLDHLFASALTNREIVLGKLFARILNVVAILAGSMPILFLTMFFGGVDPAAVLVNCLLSFACVLSTASISICISVWSKRARDAYLRSFVCLTILLALPAMLMPLVPHLSANVGRFIEPVVFAAYDWNPFVFLIRSLWVRAMSGAWTQWGELVTMLKLHGIVSAAMLTLAIWKIRHVHLHEVAKPKSESSSLTWVRWKPKVGSFPMVWKEMYGERSIRDLNRTGQIVVLWSVLILIIAPLLFIFGKTLIGRMDVEEFHYFAVVFSACLCTGFLILAAARAATSITSEKESGCWEVLLTTPLSATRIILGKMVGNLYAFRQVLQLVLLVWLMAACFRPIYLLDALLMLLATSAIGTFLVGTGVFMSLISPSSTRASWVTMFVSILFVGLYLIPVGMFTSGRMPDTWQILFVPRLLTSIAMAREGNWGGQISLGIAATGIGIYLAAGIFVNRLTIFLFDTYSGRSTARKPNKRAEKAINNESPVLVVT